MSFTFSSEVTQAPDTPVIVKVEMTTGQHTHVPVVIDFKRRGLTVQLPEPSRLG